MAKKNIILMDFNETTIIPNIQDIFSDSNDQTDKQNPYILKDHKQKLLFPQAMIYKSEQFEKLFTRNPNYNSEIFEKKIDKLNDEEKIFKNPDLITLGLKILIENGISCAIVTKSSNPCIIEYCLGKILPLEIVNKITIVFGNIAFEGKLSHLKKLIDYYNQEIIDKNGNNIFLIDDQRKNCEEFWQLYNVNTINNKKGDLGAAIATLVSELKLQNLCNHKIYPINYGLPDEEWILKNSEVTKELQNIIIYYYRKTHNFDPFHKLKALSSVDSKSFNSENDSSSDEEDSDSGENHNNLTYLLKLIEQNNDNFFKDYLTSCDFEFDAYGTIYGVFGTEDFIATLAKFGTLKTSYQNKWHRYEIEINGQNENIIVNNQIHLIVKNFDKNNIYQKFKANFKYFFSDCDINFSELLNALNYNETDCKKDNVSNNTDANYNGEDIYSVLNQNIYLSPSLDESSDIIGNADDL